MSEQRNLRQKILNSFLATLFIVAAGAEITSPVYPNLPRNELIDASSIGDRASGPAKASLSAQLKLVTANEIVASRFYAPTHGHLTRAK